MVGSTPRPTDRFPVQILQGNAYFNDTHTAFALTLEDGSQFFGQVGVADGRECVPEPDLTNPTSIFMDIRVGIVRTAPTEAGGGGDLVVWIRCLGPPTAP
jgi:hypothetical protein